MHRSINGRLAPRFELQLLPSSRFFALVLALLVATSSQTSEQPASRPARPVLYLVNGRSQSGEVQASGQTEFLRWQIVSSGSTSDIDWKDVSAIQWPPLVPQPKPTGEFCFELAAGDLVYGSLLALDDQQAVLDVPRLGHLHVRRSTLHRISRWHDGADLVYVGPNGLAGWHEPEGRRNWLEDSGRPTTDRAGASIFGDFGLPDRSSVEFEISWKSRPDFVFALGVDNKPDTAKRAFRFEVWGGDLVVQREVDREADLAVPQEVSKGTGRVHVQAYLDQSKGRIVVFSPGGDLLADLRVRERTPAVRPGLHLWNLRGDVRLEWLRIARWNGAIPGKTASDRTRVLRTDGSINDGQLIGWDFASKEFLLRTDTGESRVPQNEVSGVFLSNPKDDAPRMIRAVLHDGTRLSGELVNVEDGVLGLTMPGIQEPLRLPLARLRSLVVLRHETAGHR